MLAKCCCCVPLRTGSIVLSVLGLMGGVGMMLRGLSDWSNVVSGILTILAYAILMYGCLKNHPTAVLVYLVLDALAIILMIFIAILSIAAATFMFPDLPDQCEQLNYTTEQCDNLKIAAIGFAASLFVGIAILYTYFWVCVYSFYKELKSGVNNTAYKA